MDWTPTPAEKRAIRAYAAKCEKKNPRAIVIEIGERSSDHIYEISCNILTFGSDWVTGVDASDLHSTSPWADLSHGVETIKGEAIVDFYVYEKDFHDHGDLLTNVQAHVKPVDGKPRLWKVTGTGSPDVEGEDLSALM